MKRPDEDFDEKLFRQSIKSEDAILACDAIAVLAVLLTAFTLLYHWMGL